jgi:cytochrome c peroxidase
MRNWTKPQQSGKRRSRLQEAGSPVEAFPADEVEAVRAAIGAAEQVVGTRKASATVMIATLAIVAASAALLLGRAAELHASLRGEVAGRFGAASAAPASEIDAPKARLGRALFWDTRISANGQVSCASCHTRDNWGSDSRSKSVDARGRETERQSQSVFHSMEASGLRWLGDRASGAAQAEGSITGSMGFARREDVVPVLERHGYGDLFRAAFPDQAAPVTPANYGIALQAYQATLRMPAPFDRWLAGQDGAMTERQLHGLRRFVETGCANCHDGPLVGGRAMQRFGITGNYWEHTGSQKVDPGLMKLTRKEQDQYVFRVPSLRNVARTQPYFHDGSVAELRHATRIMAQVQLGKDLSEGALDELVAFLEALTGQVPDHYAPPPSFPEGSSPAANRP